MKTTVRDARKKEYLGSVLHLLVENRQYRENLLGVA
jgi:hypothetical protein